jgi:hypothetical protein
LSNGAHQPSTILAWFINSSRLPTCVEDVLRSLTRTGQFLSGSVQTFFICLPIHFLNGCVHYAQFHLLTAGFLNISSACLSDDGCGADESSLE